MDKGSDNWVAIFKEGEALFNRGMFRDALSKFKRALTYPQNPENAVNLRIWIIDCHDRLQEVSSVYIVLWQERCDNELTAFLSDTGGFTPLSRG